MSNKFRVMVLGFALFLKHSFSCINFNLRGGVLCMPAAFLFHILISSPTCIGIGDNKKYRTNASCLRKYKFCINQTASSGHNSSAGKPI